MDGSSGFQQFSISVAAGTPRKHMVAAFPGHQHHDFDIAFARGAHQFVNDASVW